MRPRTTFVLVAFAALLLGNCGGDQATFRDCATKGEARMFGGGEITCEVKRSAA